MKTRLVFPALITIMLFSFSAKSQEFNVPANYEFKTAGDYTKYEKDIIACADWLENSPLDKDVQKRKEASAFLIKWITGSPTVSIGLNADLVMKYFEKNGDFLVIFMAGWTRYALQNNYSKDQQKGYYEGYKSVITVYKKGIGVTKNKDLEKLIKMYDKGELEAWIAEKTKS
jgi:hypothetical protein